MKKLLVILLGLFLLSGTSYATILFEDDFEGGLSDWATSYGQIVIDPTNQSNQVLNFSNINSHGDAFTASAFIDGLGTGTYTLEFDYYSFDSTQVNGGGFVGVDPDGIRANGDHTWLLGTNDYGGGVINLPISNGNWVSVSHTFTTAYPQIHLMIEDFRSPAADAFFDNIKLSDAAPVPEPATMLLLGTGLIGLAGMSRKKFLKK